MPAIKKTGSNIGYGGGATVSNSVKTHANDPFFIKKEEEAKIAVSKLVMPKNIKK